MASALRRTRRLSARPHSSAALRWGLGSLRCFQLGLFALCCGLACHPAPRQQVSPPVSKPIQRRPVSPKPPSAGAVTQHTKQQTMELALASGATLELIEAQDLLADFPPHLERDEVARKPIHVLRPETSWLALDDHPPRAAAGRTLTLAHLLNEDEEVAPGFHRLTVFERTQGALTFHSRVFSVESKPLGLPRAPGCVIFLPHGTYNGSKQTQDIELLSVPLQANVTRMDYVAKSPGFVARGEFVPGQIALLRGAPNGDLTITATCSVGDEKLPQKHRVITLNSDTPDPESLL